MSKSYFRRDILRLSPKALLGFSCAHLLGIIKPKTNLIAKQDTYPTMETVIADLNSRIPLWLQQYKIAGLSLAIINNKELLWHRSFGFASYNQQPISDNNIFAAASLSKPLFAYGVMKLVERGQLNLDTPLTEYTSTPYIKDARLKIITARQVLSHKAGFPNWSGDAPVWIENTPGTKFSYSSEGYLYLQKVVEEITGKALASYIDEQLLTPLGMNNSSYIWQPNYNNLATMGHDRSLDPVAMKKPTVASAAGSLRTTAQDYAQFIIAMMQSGTTSNHLLTESSLEEMLRSQIQLNYYLDWGLGWGLEYSNKQKYFWHWGDAQTYKAFAIASRELGTGVVILTNSQNGLKICPAIVSTVMSGDRYALNLDLIEY